MFDMKKYSVDQLLKDRPEKIPDLKPINDEGNYSLQVNKVILYDIKDHEIIYGKHYVIIKFINNKKQKVAAVSAFGSCGDDKFPKPDECFYVGYGEIVSETSLRVMKHDAEEE
jgi:hypothetical protein